ncbi:Methyltransferase domain-containing protein [Catalinimonas alkaloidigena]|uniref:Methyltransferase domain-containing protein n=1 Tax=Catalinimonas alkaloidigena TaxID=1075417 RepID=A0A1G9KPY6_9BACT|nr:class I SAM-dependent methyltransferase [Catalinimonas alkaloidigena]SDL51741.1 Methyltransferase domain-containing protein [Catalinimonas alkaloidigena]
MTDTWLDRWNDRYRQKEFAYGTQPNEFLKEQLDQLKPGKILFGAEGEGRNAVYAAKLGWEVFAFDISVEGKNKALKLAKENKVSIDYQVGQLPDLNFEDGQFDALALIYAHFPPNLKSEYHQLLDRKLKKGGIVLVEAFGKNHLAYRNADPKIGGPADLETLLSTDELKSYFKKYEILQLEEKEVQLHEGLYHNGKGSVTRFVGRKE